jgi:hypothetical protein
MTYEEARKIYLEGRLASSPYDAQLLAELGPPPPCVINGFDGKYYTSLEDAQQGYVEWSRAEAERLRAQPVVKLAEWRSKLGKL